jgi:hypothetical protein
MYESDPVWDPDRHLERVYRRGGQLRRRRRTVLASLPAAAVIVVGALVVNTSASRPQGLQVADGGARSTTTVGDAQSHAHGGSAAADSPEAGSGADGAADLNPSGQGPSSQGTAGHGASGPSTGAASLDSGSRGGLSTGGSTSAAGNGQQGSPDHAGGGPPPASNAAPTSGGSPCSASALSYSTTTDRAEYAPGQPVAIYLVVRNRSSQPCQGPGPCGIGPWASVTNASGSVVWQSHPIAATCVNPPPGPPELQPGQSATYQAGTWNQEVCATSGSCSGPAPPGTYRAVAHRGDVTASGTRFSIS